jgi:hypothetical protein
MSSPVSTALGGRSTGSAIEPLGGCMESTCESWQLPVLDAIARYFNEQREPLAPHR